MADAKNNSGISVQQLVKLLHRIALRCWGGFISAFVFISALLCLLLLIKIKFWSFWYFGNNDYTCQQLFMQLYFQCSVSGKCFPESVKMQVTWKNHLQSLLLLKNVGTSSFFMYKCKQEIIPFFFLLVRLYRWTTTVVLALMQSWAWTFIMLEKKNQGNLIAGNPWEIWCEGQFCGIALLPIYATADNLQCYRYPQTNIACGRAGTRRN